MKKLLFILCFLISFISSSITLFAQKPDERITITLDQLNYTPQYAPLFINQTLYLSGYDLADMTYGTFMDEADTLTLAIQDQTFIYQKQNKAYSLNHYVFIPVHPIHFSSGQIPYFPINILDKFNYPYSYTDHQLALNRLMPYSTSTDRYTDHYFVEVANPSYADLLTPLMKPEEITSFISETKKTDSYFSFISALNKSDYFRQMKEKIITPSAITLYMREIKVLKGTPTLAGFRRLPVSYLLDDQELSLNLDRTPLSCNCFWATYNPMMPKTAVDLNKSLDVMMMRTFYEYYRNTFGMKDNLSTLPISRITYGRSDYMIYPIYFTSGLASNKYQVIIYKQTNGSAVNYYIDLLPQNNATKTS